MQWRGLLGRLNHPRTETPRVCNYSSNDGQVITVEDLSEHVERAIDQHFLRPASEPKAADHWRDSARATWIISASVRRDRLHKAG